MVIRDESSIQCVIILFDKNPIVNYAKSMPMSETRHRITFPTRTNNDSITQTTAVDKIQLLLTTVCC